MVVSLHKKISFIKSAIRIVGYFLGAVAIPGVLAGVAFSVLVISELVGIYEERGEK
jgi:hypothetical protein